MRGLVGVTCGTPLWLSLGWTAAWGQTPGVGSVGAAGDNLASPGVESENPRRTRPEQGPVQAPFPPWQGRSTRRPIGSVQGTS